jgi:tetratricopeptide (TPR) repeat protein
MDIFDNKFMPALKAEDFTRAEATLNEYKLEATHTMYTWAKSLLYCGMGQIDKANIILSEIINSDLDENKICQHTRGDNYLNSKQYIKALADFDVVLLDKSPKVQEMLSTDCLFRKAFILAVLGDNEFNNAIDKLAPDTENFITDAIYDKASLIKIYTATKKPLREKPKLE